MWARIFIFATSKNNAKMVNLRKKAFCTAAIIFIVSIFGISIDAQSYNDLIKESPERAGGVYHFYEYAPSALTKAPKGYKPFYISHYGRHGSRYHTSSGMFSGAVENLSAAEKAGLLTEEGKMLKRQLDTVWAEHQGMFGMLTQRGAAEHRGIAGRMAANYPEVFRGKNRREVECVSSYWPRCLVSMTNFTEALREKSGDLEFRYLTGPKYLNYISMDLDTKTVSKESSKMIRQMRDSLVSCERFFGAIFTDTAKAMELIDDPRKFMDNVFVAGGISPNTEAHPDILSHFTTEELVALWIPRNDRMYYNYGISQEAGEYVSAIAKPLIEDIIAKADAAVEQGSRRAADLRFGHDVGLLPLLGTIGIAGMENRMKASEAHRTWFDFRMMPMGSNLQMIFYRNRKGDVLVKLVYNDKETTIPAVKTVSGPYCRWEDLKEYLNATATAISDEFIVKDNGEKERTGVAGM